MKAGAHFPSLSSLALYNSTLQGGTSTLAHPVVAYLGASAAGARGSRSKIEEPSTVTAAASAAAAAFELESAL